MKPTIYTDPRLKRVDRIRILWWLSLEWRVRSHVISMLELAHFGDC